MVFSLILRLFLLHIFFYSCSISSSENNDSFPVLKGEVIKKVTSTGFITPVTSKNILIPRRVWGTIEMLAPEGKQVKKGELIAKVNVREFQENHSHREERLAYEKIRLKKIKSELPLDRLKIDVDLKSKRLALKDQHLNLNELNSFPRINEKVKSSVDIDISQIELNNYPYKSKLSLHKKGYISEQEKNENELEKFRLQTNHNIAHLNQHKLSREYRHDTLKKASLQKEKARLNVDISKVESRARKSSLNLKTQSSKFKVKRLTKRYKSVQDRIAKAKIFSPIDGIVLYPKIWGWKKVHIGMEVWGGFSFLNVANIEHLKIETRINELEISQVEKGLPVDIKSNSFPEKVFKGKVSKVGKLAKYLDESNPRGLKYFDVDITMNGKPNELRTNMSVDLNIMIHKFQDVHYVPLAAIHKENEKEYMYLDKNGVKEKISIKTVDQTSNFAILSDNFPNDKRYYLNE